MTAEVDTSHPGIVKAVWLHLLVEGGHWKLSEVADLMRCSRRRMDSVICGMVQRGYVARFREGERKNGVAYGVTPACRVPAGITLREMSATPPETARACEAVSKAWTGRKGASSVAANDSRRAAA